MANTNPGRGGQPNRTEREMAAELAEIDGLLYLNVYVGTGRRQAEVDGVLITPDGITTIEAKASNQRGELKTSRNDDWYIGQEVAELAGKSNPLNQTRLGAQMAASMLGGNLGRVGSVCYLTGGATLAGGFEDIGDIRVAVAGNLARAVADLDHERRGRGIDRWGTWKLGVQDVRSIIEALELPGAPSDEELLEMGFVGGSLAEEIEAVEIERQQRSIAAEVQARADQDRARADLERTHALEDQHLQETLERFELSGGRRQGASLTRQLLGPAYAISLVVTLGAHPCQGAGCSGPTSSRVTGERKVMGGWPGIGRDGLEVNTLAELKEVLNQAGQAADSTRDENWQVPWADQLVSTNRVERRRDQETQRVQATEHALELARAAKKESRRSALGRLLGR